MSKRRKEYPPHPAPLPSALLTDADQQAPPNPTVAPFAVDPLDAYDELKHDVYCRRQIVWDIYRSNEDAQSIESALVGALADSEIVITSTKPTAQQTEADRAEAKRLMQVINRAMGRRGGYLEFLKGFIAGFNGSVTGAFVQTVFDNLGEIVEIGIIDPMSPRPYYQDATGIYYDQSGNRQESWYMAPSGIWYKGSNGFYTTLPSGLYYQATYGSMGRGAFVVGRPLAEENLKWMALGTSITQFLAKSILGLDASQVLVMNFVDKEAFFSQLQQRKEALRQKRVAGESKGNVLAVTQNNPDKGAEIKTVNLRGLPEGIDILEAADLAAAKVAKGFGVKPSRTATLGDKSRYAGSGAQAAQQESDEWGFSIAKSAVLTFLNEYVIGDKPFVARIMGTDDPKSYSRVVYEGQVAQNVSQLAGLATTPDKQDQLWQYMVERGVMPTASIGAIAVTQTSAKALTGRKASDDPAQVDKNVEACSQDLNALWAGFVANDLPQAVDRFGIDDQKLRDELFYIAQLLIAQTIRCIRNAAGGVRDAYIRNLENQARIGINNLVGRPEDWTSTLRPRYPAYSEIINFSPLIAVGTATLADLQNRALRYGGYVDNYANLSKQANWYALGQTSTGRVQWIRTAQESCPDCVAFEGIYNDMNELLARTGGRLPGSPALADQGHCKCYLQFGV